MSHNAFAIFVLCTALAALTYASPASSSDGSAKFAELTDQFVKESLALSQTNASAAGYHKHVDSKTGKTIELDGLLDDLSLQGIDKQRAFYAHWRERFHKETPVAALNIEDAADWQLIDNQIGLNLLEFDKIQNYRHNPTAVVELIGSAIFLPLTQGYASKEVRMGHVLSRMKAVPALLDQMKTYLSDSDPAWVKTAVEENDGNVDLVENTVKEQLPVGSTLKAQYEQIAPSTISALKDFSKWLQDDLGKRPSKLSWRLGKELYDQKFRLVMETDITPEQLLADAESDLKSVRAEML